MCLTLAIELPTMSIEEAKRIARTGSSGIIDVNFVGTTSLLGRSNPRLSISELGEGCACSMLTDEADWNAPEWDIRPELLPHIANALAFICEQAPNGVVLEALWAGDKLDATIELSLEELTIIVMANRLSTKAKYIVTLP
mgnify:CR=1 FL=1